MVKRLDEKDLATIDHVGIALVRAASAWRQKFSTEMAERGYPWHKGARGDLLQHMGPSGRSQAELTALSGLSKQAVQQLLDQLETDGVVRRVPDPADRRGRFVEMTALGLQDFAERTRVKRRIEADYVAMIGRKGFAELMALLAKLR